MSSEETTYVEFIGGHSTAEPYQADQHVVRAGRMRAFRYHKLPAQEAAALIKRHPSAFKEIEAPPPPATANPRQPEAPAPAAPPPAAAGAGDISADAAVSSTQPADGPPEAPAPAAPPPAITNDAAPAGGTQTRRGRGKDATQTG